LAFALAAGLLATAWSPAFGVENPAAPSIPAPGVYPTAGEWMEKFKAEREWAAQGNADLVFLGDSITEFWCTTGVRTWQQHFAERGAANFGLSGDRTQNVLWRIQEGNFGALRPKLVVLMIGTNNCPDADSAEDIAAGIGAVVTSLREKLPTTRVLVLANLPRERTPSPLREKVAKTGRLAARLADNKMVYFLDTSSGFLNPSGEVPPELLPDGVHLSAEGYERWAAVIEPAIVRLLKMRPPKGPPKAAKAKGSRATGTKRQP
jgi:beta-glucosidase